MLAASARLRAILRGLGEAEFRAVSERLQDFFDAVAGLPRAPAPRRTIGFQPPPQTAPERPALPTGPPPLGMCHVLEADPRVLLGLTAPGSVSGPQQRPEDAPHVRRLTLLARELRAEEVIALQGVAKVMLEGRRRKRS